MRGVQICTPYRVHRYVSIGDFVTLYHLRHGNRPRLWVGLAAFKSRENTRQRPCAAGIFRAGNQHHDIQPLPHKHVPARCGLREVRHRL